MEKIIRLLRLSRLLLRKRGPRLEMMAEELGVSKRTVYRDLLDLEEMGWKIRSNNGRFFIDRAGKCPMCGQRIKEKRLTRKPKR